LKNNGIAEFPNDLTLEQIIGGRYIQVIRTDLKIPYIFTTDGWNNYVQGSWKTTGQANNRFGFCQ